MVNHLSPTTQEQQKPKSPTSNINTEQQKRASVIVPIAIEMFEFKYPTSPNRTPDAIEEITDQNYKGSLNRQTNTFTIAAKDSRGDLIRVEHSSVKIKYAANLTDSDISLWQDSARKLTAAKREQQKTQRQQPPQQAPPNSNKKNNTKKNREDEGR